MNTEHTHEQGANPPIEELRAAIERYALVREGNGVRMVANEKSGARAAWLFDFRSLMLQPEWLDRLAEVFWERFASKLPFQVGGIETAGIPLVAAIIMKSVQRKTPVNGFYVRKSRKRYGLMKYIEGTLGDDPIILVDDLIHSGESIRKQLDIIEQAGKKVSDVFVLLAYRPDDSYEFLRQRGTNLTRLFTLPDFGLPYQRTPVLEKEAFEVLWRYAAPEPSLHIVLQKSAPVADSERVYFGRDDGSFISLNAHDGSVAWEFKAGKHPFGKGILSSPALHRDRVFFGSYDGNVYALDAASGQKVWVHADADWVGSSRPTSGSSTSDSSMGLSENGAASPRLMSRPDSGSGTPIIPR
jgi:orotate phosphoribosyltransferase